MLPAAGSTDTGPMAGDIPNRPTICRAMSLAGLIAVGEPTIEQGLDKALTKAAKVVRRTVEATTDEIASELQEALKS
jgi:hypothetical protein